MRNALLVLMIFLFAVPLAAGEQKKKVAVIDLIDDSATIDAAVLDRATQYLWDRVVASNAFVVIARDRQKEAVLVLRKESFKECYDKTCNIQLAQRLSADTMLETRVSYFGGQYTLSMSLTDLAKVAADRGQTAPFDGSEAGLKAAIDALVAKLTGFSETAVGEASDWRAAGQELVIVEFKSATPQAAVSVDGKLLCTALPCRKNLTKGKHTVLLQAPHYLENTEELTVVGPVTLERELNPDFALITVGTIPDGLSVEVDRKPAGVTPMTMRVPPGLHRVTVNSPCHLQKGLEFAVKRGEERRVDLVPETRKAGLSVISEDASGNAVPAPVIVDGVEVGKAPGSFTVPLCSKKIAVIISESDKYEADLNLQENKTDQIRATLRGELDAVAQEGHDKSKEFAADKKAPEMRRPYLYHGAGILGAGMLVAIGGTGLVVAAIDKFDDYQTMTAPSAVAKEMVKPGFDSDAYQRTTDKVYKDAETLEYGGIAMFAVGGAAIVTGIVLMALTEEVPVQAAVTPNGVYIGWRGEW
ncbi:MAG TPA: PEGA domain-containing protein [bacterium]|nr:PEGA domain-containing protein [bacterium]